MHMSTAECGPSFRARWTRPVKFFSKLINLFVGYFDPLKKMIIKINIFRGDLSSISAKTATLDQTSIGFSFSVASAFGT